MEEVCRTEEDQEPHRKNVNDFIQLQKCLSLYGRVCVCLVFYSPEDS